MHDAPAAPQAAWQVRWPALPAPTHESRSQQSLVDVQTDPVVLQTEPPAGGRTG